MSSSSASIPTHNISSLSSYILLSLLLLHADCNWTNFPTSTRGSIAVIIYLLQRRRCYRWIHYKLRLVIVAVADTIVTVPIIATLKQPQHCYRNICIRRADRNITLPPFLCFDVPLLSLSIQINYSTRNSIER